MEKLNCVSEIYQTEIKILQGRKTFNKRSKVSLGSGIHSLDKSDTSRPMGLILLPYNRLPTINFQLRQQLSSTNIMMMIMIMKMIYIPVCKESPSRIQHGVA